MSLQFIHSLIYTCRSKGEPERDDTFISGIYRRTPLCMLVWTFLTGKGRLLHKLICDQATINQHCLAVSTIVRVSFQEEGKNKVALSPSLTSACLLRADMRTCKAQSYPCPVCSLNCSLQL